MAAPNFWDNPEAAQETVQRLKAIKAVVEPIREILAHGDDLNAMAELLEEGDDPEVRAELESGFDALAANVNRVELLTLLSGHTDHRKERLSQHAGLRR